MYIFVNITLLCIRHFDLKSVNVLYVPHNL